MTSVVGRVGRGGVGSGKEVVETLFGLYFAFATAPPASNEEGFVPILGKRLATLCCDPDAPFHEGLGDTRCTRTYRKMEPSTAMVEEVSL